MLHHYWFCLHLLQQLSCNAGEFHGALIGSTVGLAAGYIPQ
jgi:hypothetical protein